MSAARLRLRKVVDEAHEISRRRGNGKLRREIWVDEQGRVVRFNLAYVNFRIYAGDNGRVLGYDSGHGQWHRHHLGNVTELDESDFAKVQSKFEEEVAVYLKGK